MKETLKNYTIKDKWLIIQYKGFFTSTRHDIRIERISRIEYHRQIPKFLFWLGFLLALLAFFGGLYLLIYNFTLPENSFINPTLIAICIFVGGIGLVFVVLAFLFGHHGVFLHIHADSVPIYIPGLMLDHLDRFIAELEHH